MEHSLCRVFHEMHLLREHQGSLEVTGSFTYQCFKLSAVGYVHHLARLSPCTVKIALYAVMHYVKTGNISWLHFSIHTELPVHFGINTLKIGISIHGIQRKAFLKHAGYTRLMILSRLIAHIESLQCLFVLPKVSVAPSLGTINGRNILSFHNLQAIMKCSFIFLQRSAELTTAFVNIAEQTHCRVNAIRAIILFSLSVDCLSLVHGLQQPSAVFQIVCLQSPGVIIIHEIVGLTRQFLCTGNGGIQFFLIVLVVVKAHSDNLCHNQRQSILTFHRSIMESAGNSQPRTVVITFLRLKIYFIHLVIHFERIVLRLDTYCHHKHYRQNENTQ